MPADVMENCSISPWEIFTSPSSASDFRWLWIRFQSNTECNIISRIVHWYCVGCAVSATIAARVWSVRYLFSIFLNYTTTLLYKNIPRTYLFTTRCISSERFENQLWCCEKNSVNYLCATNFATSCSIGCNVRRYAYTAPRSDSLMPAYIVQGITLLYSLRMSIAGEW